MKLNNTLVNNQQGKEEITWKIRKYFEMNQNEYTTHQDAQNMAKVELRGKFIAVKIYLYSKL